MKIECSKENLLNGISIAEKSTGKNLTLPVLGCILIESKKNIVTIRATNLDLGIEIKIPSNVIENGIVAVPGNILYSSISAIYSGSKVILELIKNNLIISTNNSRTLINSYPHSDFPTLPTVDKKNSFEIKASTFLKGLEAVWYSSSTSTIKPELSSVYIYTNDKKILFVGTDSFRLSEKKLIHKNIQEFDPILIPIRNVPEIIKVLEYLDEDSVEIALNENQISFTTDKIYLTSRLIDGTFPDYKQIIPKKHSTEVILLKQDLINVLKKINIFSDKFNQVKFYISTTKKKFTLHTKNNDVGETTEIVQAAITGEDLDINFNHRYINDCLQSITSDSISLSFDGVGKPVVISGVSDPSYLYLVMPMNR